MRNYLKISMEISATPSQDLGSECVPENASASNQNVPVHKGVS